MSARPIRLVLVSYSYPPVLGGSEMEAQRICAALIRRGHQVKVLCAALPQMPDQPQWVDPEGVPVQIFGHGSRSPQLDRLFALGVARTLWKERREYDLVYFLMQGLHLAAGLPVARLAGKPIVMKVSGSSLITLMRQSFLGRLELRWLRAWAHRIMILNPGMAEEAVDAGLPRNQLLWMPNPVDTAMFAPCSPERRLALRRQLDLSASAPVMVYTGRLAPEKELISLLKGFAIAARQFPDAVLLMIGDGPERGPLQALAGQTGLAAQIRFTGRLPVDGVCSRLQAADVFALVSSNEGLPCSLIEAMAAGLPSVVSDIPANRQLIDDGVHGLHSAVNDEASIAAALTRLFSDPGLRTRMGEISRQRVVETYSTDKVLDRYEALFAEALRSA